MTKEEFLNTLYGCLRDQPQQEATQICDYYYEYITDAVESGADEGEVVASLGDPMSLAYELKTKQSFETAKKNPGVSNVAKVLIALLGICALPIAFPILIAVIAVVFALFVALISVGVALLVALFASVFAAGGLVVQAITMVPQNPGAAIFLIGVALVAAGILILALFGLALLGRKFIKWFISLCQRFINWVFKKRR